MALHVYAGSPPTGEITSSVLNGTLRIENSGARELATCSFDVVDKTGSITTLVPEGPVRVTDGATIIFEGLIRNRTRSRVAGDPRKRYRIGCQDYTSLLTDDVVDANGLRTGSRTDKAEVEWLLTTFGTKGVTTGTTIQNTGTLTRDIDYTGMNLYEALQEATKWMGTRFYVGFTKALHWFVTESTANAWNLSDSPSPPTSYAFRELILPDDTVQLVNAVFVIGTGCSAWSTDAGSIATYGRREGTIRDTSLTTEAACQTVGAAYLPKHAYPRQSATITYHHKGQSSPLIAGTTIAVTDSRWGLSAVVFNVAKVTASVKQGGLVEYTAELSDGVIDIGSLVRDASEAGQKAILQATNAVNTLVDTTIPAVPTSLSLQSAALVGADGNAYPVLTGTWDANGESDFDAYEIEVERALQGDVTFSLSASGAGGSLPAGTYVVKITGVGAFGGETTQLGSVSQAVTAGQRLYVNITAKPGCTSYKVYATRATNDPKANGQTTSTTGSNVEITSEGAGASVPATSSALGFLNPKPYRTNQTTFTTNDVMGGTYYGVRLRAVDDTGNRSAFCTAVGTTVVGDSTAPDIPTGLALVAGYRMIGARWAQNTEADLARYEVRFTTQSGGAPDAGGWVVLTTSATAIVIDGLGADTTYYVQVRAVDRSGNASDWSNQVGDYKTAIPTLVGSADVAFNSVITATLSASSSIDATSIKAGTLSVGGGIDRPDYLLVYDSTGQEIGRWDEYGLLVKDPANSQRQMKLVGGVMSFTQDGGATWGTAISADGIRADSILLGTAPGGHNAIPNASFELSAFNQLATVVWTTAANWQAHIAGSDVNINDSGTELTMTTVTY